MSYNQSIVKNLLKSTVESERLKLLSELKLVHSADRVFHIFTTRQAKNCFRTSKRLWCTYSFYG